MLLGPWESLDFRREVKEQLCVKGYTVIIMEDDEETKDETMLDIKFERIAQRYEPVFIAFFLEGQKMEGVIFEIGYICGKYGIDRLMLLSSKKYDWYRTTGYMNALIPRVITADFDESITYHKASERIHSFATGYILRRRAY
jgi:hypothetical protein